MRDREDQQSSPGNFLRTGKQTLWFRRPGQLLAVVCAIALTAGVLHLIDLPDTGTDHSPAAAAQSFATAAAAAFADSPAVSSDPVLPSAQRSVGLPTEPVEGLTSATPAGPVQLVLPAGLGAAQHTPGGQVVYPDTGAGFDFLAENTATGTRTVARINDPAGVRTVTTFVRTPADTVMLAHTNGYLTLNRATPTAETIGMFSPAETRDSTGRLVPSSYVVRQIRAQLYQLSEVIDPKPGTSWPVYVDPPLHLSGAGGAPLPQFSFSDVTGAITGAASAVSGAVATAASATVSGAKAVGSFVKENPLESAMLVGGVALALTGVGGPAGAAAIAAATANLGSAALDIAATAMPDNELLGNIATGFDIASALTPQGAGKKLVEEGAKAVGEQLAKHAGDIVDVAKVAPTPPTQLADNIATAATPKASLPGVSTPKAPNAPPPASPLNRGVPCAGQSFSPDTAVLLADHSSRAIAALMPGDRVWSTDPATGVSGPQIIQAVSVNHDHDLLDVTVTNPAGEQAVIHTTAGHPFYATPAAADAAGVIDAADRPAVRVAGHTTGAVPLTGHWTNAADLHPGDRLTTPDHSTATAATTAAVPGTADMWDLTIEATHTFYITTNTANVLVHNCPAAGGQFSMGDVPKGGGVYRVDRADGTPKYVGQSIDLPDRIPDHLRSGKFDPDAGDTIHFPHQTDNRDALNGLEQREMNRAGTRRPSKAVDSPDYNGTGLNKYRVYDPEKRPEAAARFEAAADRHIAEQKNSRTEQQRSIAHDSARNGGSRSSGSSKSASRSEHKKPGKKPKKKSSSHKKRKKQSKKRKGQK